MLAVLLLGGPVAAQSANGVPVQESPRAAPRCDLDAAVILGADGRKRAQFRIEIADDEAERAQGLMFRDSISSSAGMLFVYETEASRAFWMKNTLIPLDIMFFDGAGELLNIVASAQPLREDALPSEGKAQFVLEIQGGLAAKLGLTAGDVLRHPDVPQDKALAPCA
ncbi:DUF192 domain-containing protein [Albirhodobacter sp. R86504]|uniref:DUF192 domain-containing protein n=1 Tax=Albirhodobacter sp. R86504 TaxID=3093848 RepID=UPI00366C5F54